MRSSRVLEAVQVVEEEEEEGDTLFPFQKKHFNDCSMIMVKLCLYLHGSSVRTSNYGIVMPNSERRGTVWQLSSSSYGVLWRESRGTTMVRLTKAEGGGAAATQHLVPTILLIACNCTLVVGRKVVNL